jgi:hypothetical protein
MSVMLINDSRQRPPRRRWLGICLSILFWLPILTFAFSNFWLRTAWGTFWLEEKIQQTTQLQVQLRGSSWLPGGQIWIDDLQVLSPGQLPSDPTPPLLTIKCLSIRPDWLAWINKDFRRITEICIDRPNAELSLDRLKALIPPPQQVATTTPPTVVQLSPNNPTTPNTATPPVTQPPALAATSPQAPPSLPSAPMRPTVWMKVMGGHLSVSRSSSNAPLLEVENIESALPIAGESAAGHVQCGIIRLQNSVCSDSGRIQLHWKFPLWETDATPLSFAGLHSKAKMQIARAPGLPFAAIVQQEKQPWTDPSGEQKIDAIQSLHRLTGYLISPLTWQGESIIEAHQLQIKLAQHPWRGFFAQSRFLLHQGVLLCQDLRLLGEDSAILVKGVSTLQGQWHANVRLTAPRHKTDEWRMRWQQNNPSQALPLIAIYNEDRQALDVLCEGNFDRFALSLDQGKTLTPPQQLFSLWQLTPTPPTP